MGLFGVGWGRACFCCAVGWQKVTFFAAFEQSSGRCYLIVLCASFVCWKTSVGLLPNVLWKSSLSIGRPGQCLFRPREPSPTVCSTAAGDGSGCRRHQSANGTRGARRRSGKLERLASVGSAPKLRGGLDLDMHDRAIRHRQFEVEVVDADFPVAVAISHPRWPLAVALDARRKIEAHGGVELEPRFTLHSRTVLFGWVPCKGGQGRAVLPTPCGSVTSPFSSGEASPLLISSPRKTSIAPI